MRLLFLAFFIFGLPALLQAFQKDSTNNPLVDEFLKMDARGKYQNIDDSLPVMTGVFLNDTVRRFYNESLVAYYSYKRDEFYQANRVFYWQLISSKVIFFVVVFLVLCGIWFAGVQFYHSLRIGEKLPDNELEVSKSGVRLHSSVLGLIILFISIMFFYLYLVHVYPIQKI